MKEILISFGIMVACGLLVLVTQFTSRSAIAAELSTPELAALICETRQAAMLSSASWNFLIGILIGLSHSQQIAQRLGIATIFVIG